MRSSRKTALHWLLPIWGGVWLSLAACGGDDEGVPDPCGDVVCGEGAVCDPVDLLCHCGGDAGPVCGPAQVCEADTASCLPDVERVCNPGTRWSPGTSAFTEATSDWQLDTIGAQGVLLSVTDVDGDGWADLIVRRGGVRNDIFGDGEDAQRHHWLLRNTGEGTFEDITEASGLLFTRSIYETEMGRPATVVASADVDNDGDLDIYTAFRNHDPMVARSETAELMLNSGDGMFAFGYADSAARGEGELQAPLSATFLDYDLDGNIDLWVAHLNTTDPETGASVFLQDRLYRGDGAGRFADVTVEAGLETLDLVVIEDANRALTHSRGWASAACDLNNDGLPEILVASYGRYPNHLWQASRDDSGAVRYLNQSVASGFAFDDNLTWTDNEFARCYCAANPTASDCDQVVGSPRVQCSANWNHDQDREPFRLGGNSAATACGDIDNDGDIDLLSGEIRHWWAGSGADGSELLVNQGGADVRFERPGDEATGLAIDHASSSWDEGHMTNWLFDFDNDGWLDIYQGASDYAGNRGRLYHQSSPLSFVELSTAEGIDHNRSHGVVAADFDRDGDLDLVVGHSRARCDATRPNDCYETTQIRFFENTIGAAGNWLQLDLEGVAGTNRAAIGARVTVSANGVTQTQEVDGGRGLEGTQADHVLHFGLGEACQAEVTVRWPNASLTTETFTLLAGHRYHVVQGQGALEAL